MLPVEPVICDTPDAIIAELFSARTFEENYRILIQTVRKHGEHVPPLVNAYMNLSPTMRTFGTAINHGFGEVEETGILIYIDDIYPRKKERHLTTYIQKLSSLKGLRWRRKR